MEIIKEKGKNTIRLIHYLFKITQTEIKKASNLKYFTANSDRTGYYTKYPIYAHKIKLYLDPKNNVKVEE